MSDARVLGALSFAALLLVMPVPRAVADVVGTGTFTVSVSFPSFTGTATFDDALANVFGTPVNVGNPSSSTFVGPMVASGGVITNFTGVAGNFTVHWESASPGLLSFDQTGNFICAPTGCTSGDVASFVGTLSSVTGTVAASLPPGLAYTLDGSFRYIGGADFGGPFGINAFQMVSTLTGSDVTVGATTSFFDSLSQTEVSLPIDVTFSTVAGDGTTTITTFSNDSGTVPGNFATAISGYQASFIDVSTTAQVTGPITVCETYPDLNDDGVVDGTSINVSALHLLHKEAGVFQDRTSVFGPNPEHQVCGTVNSLSFFVLAVLRGSCGATNGTSCNDNNACTLADTCENGTCTGSNPVVCTAQDQCHVVGTCDPTTGTCSNPSKDNGSACTDNNACTQIDACQGGVCTGANPVVCAASDQCHVAGTCDPATGQCSNPAADNGTACNDGHACTQTDICNAGSCIGTNFSWSGVLQPINSDGTSIFKLGSTIPVKFRLTGACTHNPNLIAQINLAKISNSIVGDYLEATSTSAANSGSTFRYDATGDQYIYNLATKPLSPGTWQIAINLGDGSGNRLTPLISLK
jgi:hypothetical protein